MKSQPSSTRLILVSGGQPRLRADALQALLEERAAGLKTTVLANSEIFSLLSVAEQNVMFELDQTRKQSGIHLLRLAPGCLCCSSKLILSTQVGRTLRLNRPDLLILELDSTSHVEKVRELFAEEQWTGWFDQIEICQTTPKSNK
ncbi:MAG: GTP-binding protein [Limnobacter sp.]|nr:GTP-binding protein [Limnobacter sp.]